MNSEKYYVSLDGHGFDYSNACYWPMPTIVAGEWLKADRHTYDTLHLYNFQHLLHRNRIEVLYRAEYKGDPIRLPNEECGRKVIPNFIAVREARLLYRIDSWMLPNALVFSSDCIARAYELLLTFPDIKPNPLVQEIIDIARLWSQDLRTVIEWEGNYLKTNELFAKWYSLKDSGKLSSHPYDKEIFKKSTEAHNAAKRDYFEYMCILRAAESCLSYAWETDSLRAANNARNAIAFHWLRKNEKGLIFSKSTPSDIGEGDKFLRAEGEAEEYWQANHLADIIGES